MKKQNNKGHIWKKHNGEIDIFAFNPEDPHNDPKCTRCGYGYCHHCQDGPTKSCTKSKVKK